jgi:HlyD family secretion protein
MKKHKKLIITVIVLLALIIIGLVVRGILKKKSDSAQNIEFGDESVIATSNYYPGIIEPEQKYDINLDSERTIESINVKVGDKVTAGQTLFTYQSKDYSLQIQQAKLEIEGIDASIKNTQDQIAALNQEKASASTEMKLQYESQIQDLNAELKQSELQKQTKSAEIDSLNKKVASSQVTSPIDGTVSSVNSNQTGGGAFITLLSSGSFRIKANVDELNIASIQEGMKATIKTRVDDKTYTGKITKIETKNTVKENPSNDYEGGEGSNENSASKYYFYVSIDNPEGLLIGQHVYVEPDMNMTEEGE